MVISRSNLIRWMTSLCIWKGPDPQLEHGQLFWPPQPISMLQITVYVSLHLGNLFSFTDCRGYCQPDWSKAAVLTLSRLTNAWWFEQQGKAVCNERLCAMNPCCTWSPHAQAEGWTFPRDRRFCACICITSSVHGACSMSPPVNPCLLPRDARQSKRRPTPILSHWWRCPQQPAETTADCTYTN